MTAVDEFIPIERTRGGYGRVQAFVDELRADPGVWKRYPHPLTSPAVVRSKYQARYPGTEWALDADGNLGARWIGT